MWQTFPAFLFAHVLADFVFQSRAAVEAKARSGRKAFGAYVRHGAAVAIWSFVVLFPWECSEALFRAVLEGRVLEVEAVSSVWGGLCVPAGVAVFLAVVHVAIDFLKVREWFGPAGSARAFLSDQGLHLLFLAVMAANFPDLAAASIWPALGSILGFDPPAFWGMMLFLTGLIVATRAGGFFVETVLEALQQRSWRGSDAGSYEAPGKENEKPRPHTLEEANTVGKIDEGAEGNAGRAAASATESEEKPSDSLEGAGALIGHAERSMVFLFLVLSGRPDAIAFILTAKSLLRFGSRRERAETEYVIVGTLVSFAWAVAVSYGTMALLSALGVAVPLWGT